VIIGTLSDSKTLYQTNDRDKTTHDIDATEAADYFSEIADWSAEL
jgi:hypothetical protein